MQYPSNKYERKTHLPTFGQILKKSFCTLKIKAPNSTLDTWEQEKQGRASMTMENQNASLKRKQHRATRVLEHFGMALGNSLGSFPSLCDGRHRYLNFTHELPKTQRCFQVTSSCRVGAQILNLDGLEGVVCNFCYCRQGT